MRIIGIDPGLSELGWGIVEINEQQEHLVALEYGTVKTNKSDDISIRLLIIFDKIEEIIKKYNPQVMAIEEVFFAQNVKTAVVVSQAKGVAILAAGRSNVKVFQYTPLHVKMALSGYGRAEKDQIQSMVMRLLHLDTIPKPSHSADALAVAITHIHRLSSPQIISEENNKS